MNQYIKLYYMVWLKKAQIIKVGSIGAIDADYTDVASIKYIFNIIFHLNTQSQSMKKKL